MNYNKTIIMGRVCQDIELRYTPKGTAVADICLAVNRKYKDDEETTFIDVTLWGRTAEVAQEYSGKGQPLHIEGRLVQESWDDKTSGQKRTKLKVVAENIQLIGSKANNSTESGRGASLRESYPEQPQAPSQGSGGDGDIPFGRSELEMSHF